VFEELGFNRQEDRYSHLPPPPSPLHETLPSAHREQYAIREALISDVKWIQALQNMNLRFNIPQALHAERGFLSIQFSPSALSEFVERKNILVVTRGTTGIGYLAWSPIQDAAVSSTVAECVRFLQRIPSFSEAHRYRQVAFLGPVCIDAPHRGQGLMGALYSECLKRLTPDYSFAATFVATTNNISTRLHIEKIGFLPTGHFEVDSKRYSALLKPLTGHS
jgi:hypothetical protein